MWGCRCASRITGIDATPSLFSRLTAKFGRGAAYSEKDFCRLVAPPDVGIENPLRMLAQQIFTCREFYVLHCVLKVTFFCGSIVCISRKSCVVWRLRRILSLCTLNEIASQTTVLPGFLQYPRVPSPTKKAVRSRVGA